MKQKIQLIFWNIWLNIGFYALILAIVYYGSPIHEAFHYIPCKLAGLSPQMSYFEVSCNGIGYMNHAIQFFYFMGPYIFESILLIILFIVANRYHYAKYLIPIPMVDILVNYFLTLQNYDFGRLIINTHPDQIPGILSIILVASMAMLTGIAYLRYRIYSFTEIIKKYLKFLIK